MIGSVRSCAASDGGTGFKPAATQRAVDFETCPTIGCRSRVKCNSLSDWLDSGTTWRQLLWRHRTGHRRSSFRSLSMTLSYHQRTECPSGDLKRSECPKGPDSCQVHAYSHSHFAPSYAPCGLCPREKRLWLLQGLAQI